MAQVTKRGDSYLIRVSAGYNVDGKQIKKNVTWTPEPSMTSKQIKKELDRQVILFEQRVKTGRVIDGNIKFCDFSELWIVAHAERQLEPKTLFRYKDLLKRINKNIGHLRLDRLQPQHLLSFYSTLSKANARKDDSYHVQVDLPGYLRTHNLSITSLAEKANLSVTTIRAAVHGKNISGASAEKICKAISARLDDLFSCSSSRSELSDKTILHHHRLISSILGKAVDWQIIFDNPANRVKPPKVKRTEAKYLDENQAKQVIDLLQNEPIQYKTMITFLIYSGLRRGELLGLKWSDIDFEQKLINIRRTSQYLPDRGIFEASTKTATSIRVIKLSLIAFQLLREYKSWQSEQRLNYGALWEDSNLVFTRHNGKHVHPDTLTGWFSSFIKRTNLPTVSIHSLRHTNATLLIAGGTDIRTVSHRLGHAQTSTTSNIYAHAIQSADEAAADTLEDLLSPVQNSKIQRHN